MSNIKNIASENVLVLSTQGFIDGKSTLVQVIALCHQADRPLPEQKWMH